MSAVQLDLLVEQAQSVFELPTPTMSYAECTLNFHKWREEASRYGLGMFDDDDRSDPPMVTRVSCWMPASSGITEIIDQYNVKREQPFCIWGEETDTCAGDVINRWLDRKDYRFGQNVLGRDTPAGKWILEHKDEMNTARRIWDARRKANDVFCLKEEKALLEERIRVEELTLQIKIREAAADRNFSVEEKRIKLKELGALDKDLRS